ncbi:related to cdc24-gtp gdp exchange factor forcdc42p [Lichtheimia corymbifera JMRC:FSU:9682]|uniref:Related to cdc24-gtp gdp exchange factor forcdc42p n=1 Tax=Lichtheimia corymbifera JMRC:FSU:9682 TaxID=1263082 RepID=A0A068RMJ9_9FUNG|nr:related to cdc24-gtp gdp exchange factor forcdc42p [Lichtheimia corymbifera JMRC:FSU:9682]
MEPVTDPLHYPLMQPSSLYHTCRSVLDGMAAVPGLLPYLDNETTTQQHNDPLSKLWSICRQGSNLCLLFNTLRSDTPIKLQQNDGTSMKPKACVYHFIIACRDHLKLPEDQLFTVTDLYQDDTNGFVKVVNTVNHLLELLEDGGMILIQRSSPHPISYSDQPKSTRDKVVAELLETERKYVHDLEKLQHCMRQAQTQQVLSPDTLHQLFGNLNALVDFQRWFLVFAESNADRAPEEQRFGQLFIQQENAFSVYEPFCANFQTAQCLVVQEATKLQQLTDITNPAYELPSLLIKPVQRVCKYPLLVQELLKATPEDWEFYEETKLGLEAIQRVAAKINETKRRQENQLLAEDLKRRVVDNRHHCDIPGCGQLLLHERVVLYRNEVDHDVLLYLFEKALLICMDEKDINKKNAAKGSKKKSKMSKDGPGLVIRGQISLSQIAQASDISHDSQHALKLFWSERDQRSCSFTITNCVLKFRNEELLKQWNAALDKLIKIDKRLSRESRAAAEALVRKHQPEMASSAGIWEGAHQLPEEYSSDIDFSHIQRSTNSSDEDDTGLQGRLRSHSHHAVSHRQHTRTGSKSSASMPPTSNSNDRRHQYYTATMPGMSLPPLPRDTLAGEFSPLSYPSSPLTGSFPSTPSISNRTSTCSAGSGQQTPQRNRTANELSSLLTGPMFLENEDEDDFCRAITAPFMQEARYRSQSSPDIASFEQGEPAMTINSRTLYHVDPKSNSSFANHHNEPHDGTTRMAPSDSNMVATAEGDDEEAHDRRPLVIKAKLNYMNDLYVIKVPICASYNDLMERIQRKVQSKHQFTLKYQDEDGDLVIMSSDEDVQIGFESRGTSNTVQIHVIH